MTLIETIESDVKHTVSNMPTTSSIQDILKKLDLLKSYWKGRGALAYWRVQESNKKFNIEMMDKDGNKRDIHFMARF